MTGTGDCPCMVTIESATKISSSEKNREMVIILLAGKDADFVGRPLDLHRFERRATVSTKPAILLSVSFSYR